MVQAGPPPGLIGRGREWAGLARAVEGVVSRTVRDEHERARQAVRARIRTAIDRFAAVHPALGRHLEASIRTGAFCSCRPSGRPRGKWNLETDARSPHLTL